MDIPIYDPKTTAILCIDFYNDLLSEQGKLWPWVKEMAEQNRLLDISVPSYAARGRSVLVSITCRTIAGSRVTM